MVSVLTERKEKEISALIFKELSFIFFIPMCPFTAKDFFSHSCKMFTIHLAMCQTVC